MESKYKFLTCAVIWTAIVVLSIFAPHIDSKPLFTGGVLATIVILLFA